MRTILQKRPLFLSLLGIVFLIAVSAIKLGKGITGWDNYSSYFHPEINLFRTLFSTWRSFRGMGVPSDSEVTDIFRQLFFLPLRLVLPLPLLDQLYFLFCLLVGVIAMYFLTSYIYKRYLYAHFQHNRDDLFAFFASFFYLFNLNTLGTFYYPMVMFISRFALLPIVLLAFLKFVNKDIKRLKDYILLFGSILFFSGSFMVPTVFIALFIMLVCVFIFQLSLKRAILFLFIFIALNAFWLLPFVNYTINKAKLVKQAPTFIDGNEGFTNKSASYLSFGRQAILYPSFFEMKYTDAASRVQHFFHPLAERLDNAGKPSLAFYFFPVLYFLGSGFILFKVKKKELFWIPFVIILFLLFSMKEHTLFGFLYTFLSKTIPFFEVIFRYGDTKFHPQIALVGSIAAAIGFIFIFNKLHQTLHIKRAIFQSLFLGIIIIPTLFLYISYFNGNLIGFFVFNKIPDAYEEIAKTINKDPQFGRVLQLPIDRTNYWKPYSWGYFGSAFLHYFLKKPLVDKTFEPGSLENGFLSEAIQKLLDNANETSDTDLAHRAQEMNNMLRAAGVRYIILDETISVHDETMDVDYWGDIPLLPTKQLIEKMENGGYISRIGEYKISNQAVAPKSILLYRVNTLTNKVSFLDQAEKIDPLLIDSITSPDVIANENIIQDQSQSTASYLPFERKNLKLEIKDNIFQFRLPNSKFNDSSFRLQIPASQHSGGLIHIEGILDSDELKLILYQRYAPTFENKEFLSFLGEVDFSLSDADLNLFQDASLFVNNWYSDQQVKYLSKMRLRVGNTVVPIPFLTRGNTRPIGDVFVEQTPVSVELLVQKKATSTIQSDQWKDIPNEGCFSDALPNYASRKEVQERGVLLTTQNGTQCIWQELDFLSKDTSYIEFETDLNALAEDNDKKLAQKNIQNNPKPNLLQICLKETNIDNCHVYQSLDVSDNQHKIIPVSDDPRSMFQPYVFIALRPFGLQTVSATISDFRVNEFESIVEEEVDVSASPPVDQPLILSPDKGIVFTLPKIYSRDAYYSHAGVLPMFTSSPCASYRTVRRVVDGYMQYVNNCEGAFFARLPFSSRNMYIWSVDYDLKSGQYPFAIMEDTFHQYFQSRLSYKQGYPDVRSGQSVQFIYPAPEYNDTKPKNYFVKQYSENVGVFTLKDMSIIPLPANWRAMKLANDQSFITYDKADITGFKEWLPSLKQVDVSLNREANYLLSLQEGYDNQWGVYTSLTDVLFGSPIVSASRCNGLTSCFEISGSQIKGNKSLWLFYWPERLSAIGCVITFLVIGSGIIFLLRKKATNTLKA